MLAGNLERIDDVGFIATFGPDGVQHAIGVDRQIRVRAIDIRTVIDPAGHGPGRPAGPLLGMPDGCTAGLTPQPDGMQATRRIIGRVALWQSSTVQMIPPLRYPRPLSCSGQGLKVATVPTSAAKLRSLRPLGLAGPQPKQFISGRKRSWMLGSLRSVGTATSLGVQAIEVGE